MTPATTISPHELRRNLMDNPGACLLDVRTPIEFAALHVRGARNLPLDQLASRLHEVESQETVYLLCKSGGRAGKAFELLRRAGRSNMICVQGGTDACVAADVPVVADRKVMSLERQVRIAAGLLVLAGVLLAALHPAFLAISAFVGGGLVFAGITDYCGMGLLLARMPWNRSDNHCDTAAHTVR